MADEFYEINVPSLGVNEDSGQLIEWQVERGSLIDIGDIIAIVETTKVVVEIESPGKGFFVPLFAVDEDVKQGQVIALLVKSESTLGGTEERYRSMKEKSIGGGEYSITKKALLLAENFSVDIKLVAEKTKGIIRESDIRAFHLMASKYEEQALIGSEVVKGENGRTLLIGGGKGASQLLSVLLHEENTTVVGILDDTQEKQGLSIMGVPILGLVADLKAITDKFSIDSIVCSVSTSIKFRKLIFNEATTLNLKLANVIHPTACFDDDVRIGSGNYIGANCYFGNSTIIGDSCFISSGCIFEHHNRIGNTVTTGPQVVTSGNVLIGDEVKFGTGIYIEPNVKIGDKAVISSGSIITQHIPDSAILRVTSNQSLN